MPSSLVVLSVKSTVFQHKAAPLYRLLEKLSNYMFDILFNMNEKVINVAVLHIFNRHGNFNLSPKPLFLEM